MRKLLFLLSFFAVAAQLQAAKSERLLSPDGRLQLDVTIGEALSFSVSYRGELLLSDCPVALQVGDEWLGRKARLRSAKRSAINEEIQNVVPLKQAVTRNHAHVLTLSFSGQYSVEFRAYDNGYAYRFVLNRKGIVDVMGEELTLRFPQPFTAHLSKTRDFWTSYENRYTHVSTADYQADDEMTYLPVLLESSRGTKLLLSESDVRDYPHMFLQPTDDGGFTSVFPKSPETWEPRGDRSWTITKERDCIARTDAQRTLPRRFAVIGTDKTIAENQMEVVLGGKCELDIWPGMMPLFQLADEYLAESHLAVEKVGMMITGRNVRTGESVTTNSITLEQCSR